MTDQEMFGMAIIKWGTDLQCQMVIEECAELIMAVSKLRRGKAGDLFNLMEEIIDVEIMLGQAKLIVDTLVTNAPWERIKKEKRDRLERMLNEK